ncbi:MAG: pilus assembly protein CpaF, partial [Blastococcus sp.]|nr:pilus assembly protein CpaF [Blastococcus sp.]
GENIGTAFVVPTVAASVDLVVHVGVEPSGQRRVREIVALPGRAEGGVIETADVFVSREGRLVRADGYPPHPERFAAHGFDLAGLLGDGRDS